MNLGVILSYFRQKKKVGKATQVCIATAGITPEV